jgi:hypothetical protein
MEYWSVGVMDCHSERSEESLTRFAAPSPRLHRRGHEGLATDVHPESIRGRRMFTDEFWRGQGRIFVGRGPKSIVVDR